MLKWWTERQTGGQIHRRTERYMTDGRQADALVNELKVARLDGHVDGCMFRWKVGRADGLAGWFMDGRTDCRR